MKNQPTRTCMGCNEKKAKNDLIRIVKNKNDEINIDRTGKFDERFIPDDLFVGYIDGYLNNRAIEPGVADKNYFDLLQKKK